MLAALRLHQLLVAAAICALLGAAGCCCTGDLKDYDINDDLVLPDTRNPQPPVAALTADPNSGKPPLEVQLDASASFDSDGTIVTYDWDFDGDGTFELLDGGATPTHTYNPTQAAAAAAGLRNSSGAWKHASEALFNPVVKVTDNDGLTDTATTVITLGDLIPPVAAGVSSTDGLGFTVAHFDASASTDADGSIVAYDWDLDHNGSFEELNAGPTIDRDYGAFGTFSATVRVTDDDGLTDTADIPVTLADVDNVPPDAAVAPTPTAANAPADVVWDAAASSDSDGTIVSYDWDMNNDGTFEILDGGVSQDASYPSGGVFTVGVRVTDDDGATDTATNTADINNPPSAAVVPAPADGDTPLDVVWDASTSVDSDGTIVSYDWDMNNDGTFEILDGGVSQNASYPSSGVFTVGVRVTDDDGATDTATNSASANEPPVAAVEPDAPSGLAPLDVVWDASGSTDSDGSIEQYDWDMDNDGAFEVTDGGATQNANYPAEGVFTVGVRVTDDDGATDTATNSVTVSENEPPVAAVSPAPPSGTLPLDVVWDASASADSDGSIEQYDWDMDNDGLFEISDGGPTQNANYPSGGVFTVGVRVTDNDGGTDTATNSVDVNIPPVADISPSSTSGVKPLDVLWDATGSSDIDGVVVQYDWDMENDGVFEIIDGSPTQMSTYPDIGFFAVVLRVTDDDGATHVTAAVATVNGIPPTAALTATAEVFWTDNPIDWDASASFDSDGTVEQIDWDMDNNGTFEIIDGGNFQSNTYPTPGDKTVSIRVTDNDGLTDTASHTVTIELEPPA